MKPLALIFLATSSLWAAEPIELKLWPEGPPGKMLPHSPATAEFIRTKAGKGALTDVHNPTITVYHPKHSLGGICIIVAPGGGYGFLSAIHEGSDVCEYLSTIGFTAVLLKYRTPTRDEPSPHEKPVQDAARAMALVRQHAVEWKVNSYRIGLLGFSAGGNLLAHLACDRDFSNLEQITSGAPNFGIMIYGGGFVDAWDPTKLKPGFTVPDDAPPMFIACAHDDGQNPIAATTLYFEYKKHNIPVELHLFAKGGHGFGMRRTGNPINDWPRRSMEWVMSMGSFMSVDTLKKEIEKRVQAIDTLVRMMASVPCSQDVAQAIENLRQSKKTLENAKAAGNKEAEKEFEERIKKLNAFFDELKKMDTITDDAQRLKKEQFELQVELDQLLQFQPNPVSP